MHALYTQISGLVGLLGFLNLLLRHAPIEKAVFIGVSTGLALYLFALIVDTAVHRIVDSMPAPEASEGADADAQAEGAVAREEALAA